MARQIRFTFLAHEVSATATLLEHAAPRTCDALWDALPVAGASHHAIYSGSEGVLILPQVVRADPENATADVTTGDIGFTWFDAGSSYGVTEAFAEICWFYDADARPSMPEGDVPVSIFARFDEGSEAFFDACRLMRRAGVMTLVVEREPGDIRVSHELVHRNPHADCADPVIAPDGRIAFTQRARTTPGAWTPERGDRLVLAKPGEPPAPGDVEGPRGSTVTLPDGRTVSLRARGKEPYGIEASIDGATHLVRHLPDPRTSDPVVALEPDGTVLCVYDTDDSAPARDLPLGVRAIHATRITFPTQETR